jgi:soluble lytic murein transglycosylase-like protein
VGLEGIISAASHLCAVPAEILRELFRVESGFDPLAVSTAGAVGLGQLMPATARFMGVKDSKDPYQNAVGSACYLASLKGNGTWRDALLSYGFGNLPKGREASTYADTILLGNDK